MLKNTAPAVAGISRRFVIIRLVLMQMLIKSDQSESKVINNKPMVVGDWKSSLKYYKRGGATSSAL
jgi:hypothetical protein